MYMYSAPTSQKTHTYKEIPVSEGSRHAFIKYVEGLKLFTTSLALCRRDPHSQPTLDAIHTHSPL